MSSHKEAPGISGDPAADNTDVYAFVSTDDPTTVTLIANFVPLEDPAGGPNFFEFGDDVLYEIHIDNDGDGLADITYQFSFTTTLQDPDTFLYNTGPIASLTDPNWNRRQTVTVKRVVETPASTTTLGTDLACPPCNIGPSSTPNYAALAAAAIHDLGGGRTVFAGQRAEGFYVDVGAIFDLGILRPFQNLHLVNMPVAPGINTLKAKNINSIALQVPKTDLTAGGAPGTDPTLATSIIGVWATASRQTSKMFNADGSQTNTGPYVQISRLANPLFNEVLIPIVKKDFFNSQSPDGDSQFQTYVDSPELAKLLPVLYPGTFPNLAGLNAANTVRDDLDAILLTGIPAGVVAGFQNYTGPTKADMLRLNMAYAPTAAPSNLGLIGGDVAGFPNGRRVFDDVTTIELRAIAGATYPLTHPDYTPDAAAGKITPGLTSSNTDVTASNTVHYLTEFPYLGVPHSGYTNPATNAAAPDLGAINQPPAPAGQVTQVPVGAPQTGGGSTSGVEDKALLFSGAAALAGAALAGGLANRRPAAVAVAVPEAGTVPEAVRDDAS